MATFRKRGTHWQAIVRRKGLPPLTKTFAAKADAALWARQIEHRADTGSLREDPRILGQTTLGDVLRRYRDEITPRKRGRDPETVVLTALLRRPICAYTLEQLSAKHLAEYRDQRRLEVGPATVNKDLNLIQHAIKIAQQEWGLPIPHNPVTMVRKLVRPPGRDRRLREGEFEVLIHASKSCRNRLIEPVIRLAVETGMRRSELLSLRWQNTDLAARTAHLPVTKNGLSRTVPLTPEAVRIIQELPRADELVLPMSAEAVKRSWQRIVKKAGLVDLRFHDLRHEAISRFFEMGLNVPEVALITGHRDGRMLFRYTHLKAENVAKKLATATFQNFVQTRPRQAILPDAATGGVHPFSEGMKTDFAWSPHTPAGETSKIQNNFTARLRAKMNDKRHQKTSDERENLEDEIRKTRAYMDHLLEAILEQACKMGLEAERRDRLHRARSHRFRDQFEELIAEYAENKMKIRALRAKQAMIGLPQQP